MRSKISTIEISERYEKPHKDVLTTVRKVIEEIGCLDVTSTIFTDSEYVSIQNKKLPMYEMNLGGFCLISDTSSYCRGKGAVIKSQILSEFGEKFSVITSSRNRFEDDFYTIMKRFFSNQKIIRQCPFFDYRVDFYFPEHNLIVEYDDTGHFSKKDRENDLNREEKINEMSMLEFDSEFTFVRVKKGYEIEGLSVIAGAISMVSASTITEYYEKYHLSL